MHTVAMAKRKLMRDELVSHLRDQLDFMQRSAEAYDDGAEGEAKRLATVIRVLVHDTDKSHSLLSLLQLKNSLRYRDSSEPINPGNLLPTPGLVIMEVTAGGPSGGGRYVHASKIGLAPFRENHKHFKDWWSDPVTHLQGATYSRRNYVLTTANKEGGAHVDPRLDESWGDLTHNNALGWMYFSSSPEGVVETPFEGNLGLASVRQIAWELDGTIREQLGHLLS
jgi:hypothetical protein